MLTKTPGIKKNMPLGLPLPMEDSQSVPSPPYSQAIFTKLRQTEDLKSPPGHKSDAVANGHSRCRLQDGK